MSAHLRLTFVTDRAKTTVVVPDEEHERPRIIDVEQALSGNEGSAYVMLADLADHIGVQTATVKLRASRMSIKVVKIRKPEAKNAYCAAVTAADARQLIAAFREGNLVNNARVLGPDEIQKLMEE